MPGLPTRLRGLAAILGYSTRSREELLAFQGNCLRDLVRHASRSVPFYRDLFLESGLDPHSIRGIEDLGRLPVAERSRMQVRPETDLLAGGYRPERLIRHRTSGSTGTPFTICRTWFEERLLHGVRLRNLFQLGLRLTDVRSGVSIGPRPHSREFHTRLGLLRKMRVDCLLPAPEFLARLAEIQPDIVGGYAGTLAWAATEATDQDRTRIRPRFVLTAAETLTPEMRQQISECFNVPVYDSYGAHEFNLIASECPATGLYHISESSVLIEVLDNGRPVAPGESGELFGTALHSYAMPIIRYRLGDIVKLGPPRCPCGAPWATLETIQGRTIDRFPLPGGTSIHPYSLIYPLAQQSPWLRRYQIVQTRIDHVIIKTVALPGKAPTQADWDRIRSRCEEALGPLVKLDLELVHELPPAKSGKFRPYYTLVGS